MLAYYGQVINSMVPSLMLFFGTLMAGKVLIFAVHQFTRVRRRMG